MPAGQKHRLHEHTGTPKILCEALEQNRIPEDYKTLYKITHFAIDDVFCCLLVVPKDGNAVTIVDHRVRCICLCCDVIMWLRKHIIVNLALVHTVHIRHIPQLIRRKWTHCGCKRRQFNVCCLITRVRWRSATSNSLEFFQKSSSLHYCSTRIVKMSSPIPKQSSTASSCLTMIWVGCWCYYQDALHYRADRMPICPCKNPSCARSIREACAFCHRQVTSAVRHSTCSSMRVAYTITPSASSYSSTTQKIALSRMLLF